MQASTHHLPKRPIGLGFAAVLFALCFVRTRSNTQKASALPSTALNSGLKAAEGRAAHEVDASGVS